MKLCYLIGYPVGHSMSSVMHNAAFRKLGLDFRYELRQVRSEELGHFVSSTMRAPDVRGANVTIPHKVTVMRYLDEVDSISTRIGAVNTIVNYEGNLKGYNTDALGAVRSIEESFGSLYEAKVIIIGAGGAAKAISYQLSTMVDKLVILNRTFNRAVELAESILGYPERRSAISSLSLSRTTLKKTLRDADIVINATPLGMSPNIDETPIDSDLLRSNLLVFDLVYNPPRTRLLKEAEAMGAKTQSGIDMLVYQGALAFKLWTGIDAPEALMKQAVEEALGGR